MDVTAKFIASDGKIDSILKIYDNPKTVTMLKLFSKENTKWVNKSGVISAYVKLEDIASNKEKVEGKKKAYGKGIYAYKVEKGVVNDESEVVTLMEKFLVGREDSINIHAAITALHEVNTTPESLKKYVGKIGALVPVVKEHLLVINTALDLSEALAKEIENLDHESRPVVEIKKDGKCLKKATYLPVVYMLDGEELNTVGFIKFSTKYYYSVFTASRLDDITPNFRPIKSLINIDNSKFISDFIKITEEESKVFKGFNNEKMVKEGLKRIHKKIDGYSHLLSMYDRALLTYMIVKANPYFMANYQDFKGVFRYGDILLKTGVDLDKLQIDSMKESMSKDSFFLSSIPEAKRDRYIKLEEFENLKGRSFNNIIKSKDECSLFANINDYIKKHRNLIGLKDVWKILKIA